MRASVATTPRTMSSLNRRSIVSPNGATTMSFQVFWLTCERIWRARGSGRSSVGATAQPRWATSV